MAKTTPIAQAIGQVKSLGHQGVMTGGNDARLLYCSNISTDLDYEDIYMIFKDFGLIERIKLKLSFDKKTFISYILFDSNISAHNACSMNNHIINDFPIKTKLCSTAKFIKEPHDFVPADLGFDKQSFNIDRKPPTPIWYVASYKEGRESIIEASKTIQRKVGKIPFENLKRYGKNILIKANDETQAELLTRFKSIDGNVKAITPHKSFNTPKGVIYSKDLAVFSEDEILDMCPSNVYQVKKLRGVNNPILVTFSTIYIPDYLTFDHLRVKVKRYRPRPTQCYNCLEYGHIVNRCSNLKKCNVCSQHHQELSKCEQPLYCFHCAENHSPTSRVCPRNKFEQEVVDAAQNQHISIGSAKRQIMSANKDPLSSYAIAVKKLQVSLQNKRNPQRPSDKSKETDQISGQVSEASECNLNERTPQKTDISTKKIEISTDAMDDTDLDTLPSLELTNLVDEDKIISKNCVNQSVTVETSSQEITGKNKPKENSRFTSPPKKKRVRQLSPKDKSKIPVANRYGALEESSLSKTKALSKENVSTSTPDLPEKKLKRVTGIYQTSKEDDETKSSGNSRILKLSLVEKPTGARSKATSDSSSPVGNRKNLSTGNLGRNSKEVVSQPEKDRIGTKL